MDTVRVDVINRWVPDDRPPAEPTPVPPGYQRLVLRPMAGLPMDKGYLLDGCDIYFVIDKETKEVIGTQIIK